MSEFQSVERFVETEGINIGRIKDEEIALEVALTDLVWREGCGGRPMMPAPGQVSESPVFYSQLIEQALNDEIQSRLREEVNRDLRALYDKTHDKGSDPELYDEAWSSWRLASMLLSNFGREYGLDYDTCAEIATLPFAEAFETAYSYLSQAGFDADAELGDFIEKTA